MRHLHSAVVSAVVLLLSFTNSIYGDVTVDDFEYGYTCNKIGTYWYFLSDTNTTVTGGYDQGNGSDSAGKLTFSFKSGANDYSMAYMGFNIDNALPPQPVDLSGATAISFDIKASRQMDILFVVSQSTIKDSITAMYYCEFNVDTSWDSITVNLSTTSGTNKLSLLWGNGSFSISKVTGFSWAYSPYYNNNSNKYSSGTVFLDNVIIKGNPKDLKPPYAPFIGRVSMPYVEWYPSADAASYGLQISKSYNFDTCILNQGGITGTKYKVPALDPESTYYWRVNASNSTNTSRWSWIGYFTASNRVIYDGNGSDGGSVPEAANWASGATVTVSANTGNMRKTGYIFTSWNTAVDGSGTSYAPGDNFTMGSADVTLYAQWEKGKYRLVYNGNGATGGNPPGEEEILYEDSVTVADNTGNLVNTGHTFSGWNTKADGSGTSMAPGTKFAMGPGDMTLYAQWSRNSYRLTYDGNGATGGSVPNAADILYGDSVTVAGQGVLVRAGYAFTGWNTGADGSGINRVPGTKFAMGAESVTLYAQWVKTYTVTYDGNGNDEGNVPPGGDYIPGSIVTVSGNTGNLKKSGFSFIGWNIASDSSGKSYTAGDTFTMQTSDITLYARWTSNPTYVVNYNGNGNDSGSVPEDPNNYLEGDKVAVKDNTGNLLKNGFIFTGWNTSADGSGKSYAPGDTITIDSSDITLYAKWMINKYTLTVKQMIDEEDARKTGDTIVMHGDTVLITADQTEGLEFIEWRVTEGDAILFDSTNTTCRIILTNGDAEITAFYTTLVAARTFAKKIPKSFGLNFNGKKGTITFAIPEIKGVSKIPVNIRIFDMRGRLNGVIVNGTFEPGYHTAKIGIRGRGAAEMKIWIMESLGYRKVTKIITQ